jgi:hypothetical protein
MVLSPPERFFERPLAAASGAEEVESMVSVT